MPSLFVSSPCPSIQCFKKYILLHFLNWVHSQSHSIPTPPHPTKGILSKRFFTMHVYLGLKMKLSFFCTSGYQAKIPWCLLFNNSFQQLDLPKLFNKTVLSAATSIAILGIPCQKLTNTNGESGSSRSVRPHYRQRRSSRSGELYQCKIEDNVNSCYCWPLHTQSKNTAPCHVWKVSFEK